ncbi:MAG: cytoplasmic protein [bacterium]
MNDRRKTYQDFEAHSLYCPKCRQAMPVRKRLLLILPDGNKYEYRCSVCASSLGTKKDSDNKSFKIITSA